MRSGQSFSVPVLPDEFGGGLIEVLLDGPWCVAIPAAADVDPDGILALNGVEVPAGCRTAIFGSADSPFRFAAPVPLEIEEYAARHGATVEYSSPLQKAAIRAIVGAGRDKCLALFFSPSTVYAALSISGALRYLDALPYSGKDDVLYLAGSLNTDFDISRADIIFSGHEAKTWCKAVRRYFGKCRCE